MVLKMRKLIVTVILLMTLIMRESSSDHNIYTVQHQINGAAHLVNNITGILIIINIINN